jgi:indole-3-glycerol phosphate synthase
MRGGRRFSQAISEGDGISFLADVSTADAARTAEIDGAEAIVVGAAVAGLREATELPILWRARDATAEDAQAGSADAYVLAVAAFSDDDDGLERSVAGALELGLDCVVAVRDEDELRLALDRLDPDIFLLSAGSTRGDEALEHVLSLLPDVPAGKLAIAELELSEREQVDELERAGVDGVIVGSSSVGRLVGPRAPEV